MKKLFVVAVVFFTSAFASANADAGCRIKYIRIKVYHQLDTTHFIAEYVGYHGRVLQQKFCPDQNFPTWGFETGVDFVDEFAHHAVVPRLASGRYVISVGTTQGKNDREIGIFAEKNFVVR